MIFLIQPHYGFSSSSHLLLELASFSKELIVDFDGYGVCDCEFIEIFEAIGDAAFEVVVNTPEFA